MPRYAVDIETDTTPCHKPPQEDCQTRGLDPGRTTITEIAIVSGKMLGEVLDAKPPRPFVRSGKGTAAEARMLTRFTSLLNALPTGVVVTWNGAAFDAPFLVDRYQVEHLVCPVKIRYDSTLKLKYPPLPGHPGGYRASFGPHSHVDIAEVFRPIAEALGVRHSLKPVARAVLGIEPIEVDRRRMHELSAEERFRYAVSDAKITLALSERIDPHQFASLIDFMEPVDRWGAA
jgi:uncharacterized protein YprB with RNaseH-like and TPR domain